MNNHTGMTNRRNKIFILGRLRNCSYLLLVLDADYFFVSPRENEMANRNKNVSVSRADGSY